MSFRRSRSAVRRSPSRSSPIKLRDLDASPDPGAVERMAALDRLHPDVKDALVNSTCDFNALDVEPYFLRAGGSRSAAATTIAHIRKSERKRQQEIMLEIERGF